MKPCKTHNVVGCTCTWTRQELAMLKRGGVAMDSVTVRKDAAPVAMDWADMFLAAVRKAVEAPFVSDSVLRELVAGYRPSKPRTKPSCRPRPRAVALDRKTPVARFKFSNNPNSEVTR
jgi:hypothetical protein